MQNTSTISHSCQSISERKASSEQTSHKRWETSQNDQQMTMIEKATLLIDSVTNLLCKQITKGYLWVDDQEKELPISRKIQPMTRNQSIMSKIQAVDIQEHQRKMKTIMEASKKMRQKRSRRILQFQKSIKMSEQEQMRQKQQERQKQLQRRKSQIQNRLANKAEMMAKIRQSSLQSDQRVKSVKSKKFLYEQKEQEFKVKFILPKIQQEKKMLERRKDHMKSIDMSQILQHQKSYQIRRKLNSVNRSMTSRFIKCQTTYHPPEYVPQSYLLYEAEQSIKKQEQILKIKETKMNKERVKQFVKNVAEIHKLQKELSKSRQKFGEQKQKQVSISKEAKKKKKQKKQQLSKQQSTNMGNQYFKALLQQIKSVKQKRKKRQTQELEKSKIKEKADEEEDLQIEIRSQEVRTMQKIEKIERNYTVRSKKIDSIFNDTTIDPLLKYQKLKHQVQNLDMVLKTKNRHSEDIKQRTEAAGSYLNAIQAKIQLLQVSNHKK